MSGKSGKSQGILRVMISGKPWNTEVSWHASEPHFFLKFCARRKANYSNILIKSLILHKHINGIIVWTLENIISKM